MLAGGGKSSRRGFLWWILSFHWLGRVTFFCMWSVKKSERLAVITHRCARTLFAGSVSYLVSSKNAFRFVPGDIGAPTFPSSLWAAALSVLPFFCHQLFILISGKLPVLHNGFFYFSLLPAALCRTHPLLSPPLPRHYCASRQKGPRCLWTREERWSSIIDKSHLGGGQWPHFFFCRIHLQSFQMLQISCTPPCRYSDDLVKQ